MLLDQQSITRCSSGTNVWNPILSVFEFRQNLLKLGSMKKFISLLFVVLSIVFAPKTFAAMSPLSVGIIPPVQFPPADFSVTGFRLSLLYGHHRDVYGLDLGLLGNITDQDFVGVGISGVANVTHGNTTAIGLQAAGIANWNTNKTRVMGLQLAAITNYNSAESSVAGLQLSLVNWSPHTDVYGAQIGIYNKAENVYGLQIGLVNVATTLHGIQIGLVNFHHQGLFSVSPIINVGF